MKDRIATYIKMVENALEQTECQKSSLNKEESDLINLAKLYLEDSKYYLEKEDLVTSLATISYAEGLLDALARLGKLKIEWKREKRKKVLITGTFDILHEGHIRLIEEASKLGDVYVIVSRDVNAKKNKGREVIFPENSRLKIVSSIKNVKMAMLGDENDYLKKVIEVSPDIIVLGPDQKFGEEQLKEELKKRGLNNVEVIRLKNRFNDFYPNSSTQVILEVMKKFCI
ncbi:MULTISPECIES: pantoate--beta-alanine ligase [Fervidicoccus]|jgi:FAD synthetase|uniref:Cytidyltransferase-related domain protein n=2 Tax=Fervidicoccus fontis TaxID=683846 RepID=I0A201_FERFK|nr:pantoate--beta-alanine ligase [Fervidicoccus fontis]AFH43008.1 cytidyltransferase-related domain protein [Fervidicoccus fontis Kam940]